jgi:diacylglycerol O-acyltransferase
MMQPRLDNKVLLMKALSMADQMFLWLEKRQQPMHVGGLHLYSFPEGAGANYVAELAEQMRSYTIPSPPFNMKLHNRFGQYYWEEDKHFDLEHHFRFEALPTPGRIRELLSLVSVNHSHLMDRARPLWECHLVEGIEGRKFALYTKAHHSMMDGVAAMRIAQRFLSEDPNKRHSPPVWSLPPSVKTRREVDRSDVVSSLLNMAKSAGTQINTIPALIKETVRAINQSQKDPNFVSPFSAPKCILNEEITGSRRFAAQSYDIKRIKAIAKACNGTLNDVVLAICGSALRNYLISQKALPNKPLIAMVPMSMREDDSDSGNQIAMILANLATHIADPLLRMELIQKSVKESKLRFSQMSMEEAVNYTAMTLAPAGLNLLTGRVPQLQTFNCIISNVPGPKKPLYWNGAKLEGMYPVSIPVDRVALNITLVSYVDHLEFGFTACRRTLPSMQRLIDYIENAIEELEIASGINLYDSSDSVREKR